MDIRQEQLKKDEKFNGTKPDLDDGKNKDLIKIFKWEK